MRQSAALAGLVVAATLGCRGGPRSGSGGDGSAAALALVEQGRFDEAISRVGQASDPESLYVLGRAWAGKARTMPLPTPQPGVPPPPEGLFKVEELTALGLLEKAVAAQPDHPGAQLALARLLAPHALAWAAAERAVGRAAAPRTSGPDASPERVLRAYADAMQADPAGTTAAEDLVRFAVAAGRLVEADAGYRELLRRRRQDPDLLVRYGDFLAGPKGSPDSALAQYAQALMWRPEDAATRLKMIEIHLQAADGHLRKQEYVSAEARLGEARRLGVEEGGTQRGRMREMEETLHEVRGR